MEPFSIWSSAHNHVQPNVECWDMNFVILGYELSSFLSVIKKGGKKENSPFFLPAFPEYHTVTFSSPSLTCYPLWMILQYLFGSWCCYAYNFILSFFCFFPFQVGDWNRLALPFLTLFFFSNGFSKLASRHCTCTLTSMWSKFYLKCIIISFLFARQRMKFVFGCSFIFTIHVACSTPIQIPDNWNCWHH